MTTINGTYGFDSTFFTFTPDKTMTPPKIFGGNVEWALWEIPIHALSNFFVPLIIYLINCTLFDEKMPADEHTFWTSAKQHIRHAIECSISLWIWQSLLLNVLREEPDLTFAQCLRNLALHFLMTDALFFWTHYVCHQRWSYGRVHKQHHTHLATPGAPVKMNALSGTCVTFLDMLIIGHTPVFAPCLVVSLPWSWMIGYVVSLNIWISLLHCVGSKTNYVPSLGGILVHPHDHAAHHKYGRENVNFGILLTFWDRAMGTLQVQDPNNFFYIGNKGENLPQPQKFVPYSARAKKAA